MGQGESKPAIVSLMEEVAGDDIAADSERWSAFWKVGAATCADLFAAVSLAHVRAARKGNPRNFARLLVKLVDKLRSASVALSADAAPAAAAPAAAAGASSAAGDAAGAALEGASRDDLVRHTLNCVRLLTRLVPVVFEDARRSDLAERLFWQHGDNAVPLAITLLDSLMALLFLPGFTVNDFAAPPPTLAQLRSRRNAVLPVANVWAAGIGAADVFPSDDAHHANRVEVLKLLLTCLSSALYHRPSTERQADSWLHYVCTRPTYYTAGLFLSLVNVACTYDPVGWGLPYNYLMFSDPREELTYISLQLLTVLLEYDPSVLGGAAPPAGVADAPATPATPAAAAVAASSDAGKASAAKNVFARYLASVAPADFPFLFEGVAKLLENPFQAASTYLPGSTKELVGQQETLTFLWRVLLGNGAFLRWMLTKADATRIVKPVLLFMLESRRDESHLGLVHLSSFLLLVFSGEREFGVTLNAPFNEHTESLGRVDGRLADVLVLTVAKLLVDSHARLAPLHECLLTVVTNVSPYVKALTAAAAAKLLQLFDMFCKPKFVFASSRNHRYCAFLLETLNNIIQYQYEGNATLVYSVIRYAESFTRLAELSLAQYDKAAVPAPTVQLATPPEQRDDESADDISITRSRVVVASDPHFTPTQAWLDEWKKALPLGTVLRLLEHMLPHVRALCDGGADDDDRILAFIGSNTLVGVLPVPHPILIRKYQHNAATASWFRTYVFGIVFVRNVQPAIFYGTNVRLFSVALSGATVP
jgi:hypothetical protein